ncbi:general secretion pathway protein K [Sinobacterium caligoides]|uniref:Type II secretion system protein K n=1 Tax=Sinobacterium caligoides TaxID=933926 RepID=A0A3N2DNF9_9GAMM|nr:type II secretion system minor pseudopilin GspK [Sinobacterium caligoides]ROS01343.1 general secretion pathway protein K [Sinobacterium caligoides]
MHYAKQQLGQERQRGVAMIMAILIVALITALVTAAGREFVLGYKRASNHFNHEQGYYYLLTAEDLAKEGLIEEEEVNPDYDQEALLQQSPIHYPLEDVEGWVEGEAIDLQGRINLNTLKKEGEGNGKHSPQQAVLSRLLQEMSLDPVMANDLVDAITDWVDDDQLVTSLSGGEDDTYQGRTPAYFAANQSMRSLSELLLIEGMNKELYRKLRPYVTVWADGAEININSAALPLMMALTEPALSESEAEELIEGRPYSDIAKFKESSAFTGKKLEVVLTVKSARYMLSSEVEVFGSRQTMTSVLERSSGKVKVLARSSGQL